MIREKNRSRHQWLRISRPEINSHLYGKLLYDKGQEYTMGEKTASSINGVGKTGQLHAKNQTGLPSHVI